MHATNHGNASRILSIEDHPLFREALLVLLAASGLPDVDWCANAEQALEMVNSGNYALCLLDLNINGFHAADLIHEFKVSQPEMRILVISMFNDVSLVDSVLRKGAHGYLCKECPPEEYVPAIKQVLAGEEYVSSDLRDRLQKFRETLQAQDGSHGLTFREMNVLSLLGRGETIKTIASQLNISPKTVESHCASTKRKLGLTSMNELIRHAVRMDGF